MLKSFNCFSFSGEGLPIAKRVMDEGLMEVRVGIIEDVNNTRTKAEKSTKPEDPDEKEKRLKFFDGILPKMKAEELVKELLALPDPENHFLFFDLNHDFKYAEQLMGHGFPGNFPTEEHRLFEVDRDMAKAFVEKNYPDLKVAEVHKFKTVEEAKKFLEGN